MGLWLRLYDNLVCCRRMQWFKPRTLILLIGIYLILTELTLVDANRRHGRKKHGHSSGKSGGKGNRKKVAKWRLKHLHVDIGIHAGLAAPPKPPEPEPTCTETEMDQNCLSCTGFIYRECPVVGAKKILDVKLKREYHSSKHSCMIGHRHNYGISKDKKSITVNYGCRGLFTVCYEKGNKTDTEPAFEGGPHKEPKIIDCAAKDDGGFRMCPLKFHQPDIAISVSYLWGFGKCKHDEDWGYDDKVIWTRGSCHGTFRVIWN